MKFLSKMFLFICVVLTPLVIFAEDAAKTDPWTVGVARIDITPKDSVWLAGYASRDHAATGALHPLWAKAMTFEDAHGNLGVLVTADVLGFPKRLSDDIRDACKSTYGLERAQIILSSTHTHTGPVLLEALYDVYPLNESRIAKIEAYSEQLKYDIIRVIGLALGHAAPAQLLADNGVVRFQVNRRNNNVARLQSLTDLNGPNDYAVPVLQVRRDGQVTAAAFGYACHPTVLNTYEWSGDYPGFAQLHLEKDFPGVTAMFFQGCGADQNPLPRRSVGLAEQYGHELAAAVGNVLENGGEPLTSELHTTYAEIDLLFSEPPSIDALNKMSQSSREHEGRWATRQLAERENGEEPPTSYSFPIQVWRLGEQAIFVLGGEVVVDYAIALKRIFGQDIFVMGYANDVMGYIPSARVLREGGYEGLSSQIVYGQPAAWRADIEARIMSGFVTLAKQAGVNMPPAKLIDE